jgi:long-chain acyl-CoA synthetase
VPTRTVLLASMGDMLGPLKGTLVNPWCAACASWCRPSGCLGGALQRRAGTGRGAAPSRPPALGPDDIAVLQYTGGTTGVSKGAVLLHRNLVANVLQSEAWYRAGAGVTLAGDEPFTIVCALPLYHIFAFTACMLLGLRLGGCNVLIPTRAIWPHVFKSCRPAPCSTASRRSTPCSRPWPTTRTSQASTGAT